MSREIVVNTYCDFPPHVDKKEPAREFTVALGEGSKPRVIAACPSCIDTYVMPMRAAYEAGAEPGSAVPPVAGKKPVRGANASPAPNGGQCPECPRDDLKNLTGWVQHMMRTHEWDKDKRELWLAENTPAAA